MQGDRMLGSICLLQWLAQRFAPPEPLLFLLWKRGKSLVPAPASQADVAFGFGLHVKDPAQTLQVLSFLALY